MYKYKDEIFVTEGGPNGGSLSLRGLMEACGETGGNEAGLFGYCLYVVEERSSGGEG